MEAVMTLGSGATAKDQIVSGKPVEAFAVLNTANAAA